MKLRPALLAFAAAALLTACGSTEPTTTAAAPSAGVAKGVAADPTAPATWLTVTDPWVKTAAKGMSAAFGTLVNHSASDLTVASAATPVSPMVELHETVEDGGKMQMRPKKGGFVIPAGGSVELKPGGNHIMLMGVKAPIEAGAEVPFTLTLGDGTTVTFTAVAKDFAGANESYAPGHGG
ncbi:copper chaperone PCu(A)C [Nonomuraea sp. NPDC050310]|uniref:copper chaperone PCu(A)C n=1 Tax=unclassified Nonomuraea TaxID=2593643 RepID=UPI0033C59328